MPDLCGRNSSIPGNLKLQVPEKHRFVIAGDGTESFGLGEQNLSFEGKKISVSTKENMIVILSESSNCKLSLKEIYFASWRMPGKS